MSRPQTRSDTLVGGGQYRLQEKALLDAADMTEFVADEIAADGTNARQVTLTTFPFGFNDTIREDFVRSISLLQTAVFRAFPAVREIDPNQEGRLVVISDYWKTPKDYWKAPKRLADVIDEARDAGTKPDLTFALYVLRTMCSSISLLHEWRVSDFKTIHGALSPQSVWIDSAGSIRCRNHFFGLALAHNRGESLDEAADVRGLGQLFWNLVSYQPWLGVDHASGCDPGAKRILEASGLLPGFDRPTVSEFSNVVDEVLAAGVHYATQKYASNWLAPKRLPAGPVLIRKVRPPEPPRPKAGAQSRQRHAARKAIWPWVVGIIVLTMAVVFGIFRLLAHS